MWLKNLLFADGENKRKGQMQELCPLTVIVPTYNRKSYLDKAVSVLKAQTLNNIKFIIVDDGSTDGSFDYLAEEVKGDARFNLIKSKKNKGPSAARNIALKKVNSEYVGFFDIDDEIPADYFEKLYQTAVSSDADIVFTNYNDTEHLLSKVVTVAGKYKVLRNGSIWDKIYKTSLLKNNDISFEENLYTADNLFNVKAFHKAQKVKLIDEPRYTYELHDDSIGKDEKLITKRKRDIINICEKAMKYAKEEKFGVGELIAMRDFLKHSYDCYLNDKNFRYKLYMILQNIDIKIKTLGAVVKYGHSEYQTVANSGFFDNGYYRMHNPSLWFSHQNLLEHYLTTGWLQGKNPSRIFDGNKYLYIYPDVAKVGINPLIHYKCHGIEENRIAFPVETLFSGKYYKSDLTPRLEKEYDLLKNSEYFNSAYYRLHNPSLWFSNKDLLEHYLIYGWQNGKNPSAEFDGNKYLAVYSDIEKAGVNPLVHYLRNGHSEGRECFSVSNWLKDLLSKVRYFFEYPIRVKEEYDRLTAEIKALENIK